jgi:hypothetical protein
MDKRCCCCCCPEVPVPEVADKLRRFLVLADVFNKFLLLVEVFKKFLFPEVEELFNCYYFLSFI